MKLLRNRPRHENTKDRTYRRLRYRRKATGTKLQRKRSSARLRNLGITGDITAKLDITTVDNSARNLRNVVPYQSDNRQLSSNMHSNSIAEFDAPISLRIRNEKKQQPIVSDHELASGILNSIESITDLDTIMHPEWKLPRNRSEANELNPNIEFQYGRESYEGSFTPLLKSVKIRYNSLKFLNFQRLLNSNYIQENDSYLRRKYIKKDSQFHEILLKSVYPYKKDYSTTYTKPSKADRILFNELELNSKASRYINSNILLTYPFEFKKLKKLPPILKSTRVKAIFIDNHEIKTLHPSPYPEYINSQEIINICENCLTYFSSRYKSFRHKLKCSAKMYPPGSLIYQDNSLQLYEIDGRENPKYCRNLCLLSMLFLKSKTLFYEVDPFVFYVLYCGNDIVGYFSKEKLNSAGYNLSCILTLPIFRRQGFGNFLMEFSYLLSKREFKLGTPEKPLSDLGLLSYRNYWKCKVAETLIMLRQKSSKDTTMINISLDEIANITGMSTTDVIFGLEQLEFLYSKDNKSFAIIIKDWSHLETINEKWQSKKIWTLKPDKLLWKPLIFGPSFGINSVNTNTLETSNENLTNEITDISTSNLDIFKKHIDLLSNFMTDDINNQREMEATAIEKITDRIKSNTNRTEVSTANSGETWSLCFKNPIPPVSLRSKYSTSRSNLGTPEPPNGSIQLIQYPDTQVKMSKSNQREYTEDIESEKENDDYETNLQDIPTEDSTDDDYAENKGESEEDDDDVEEMLKLRHRTISFSDSSMEIDSSVAEND